MQGTLYQSATKKNWPATVLLQPGSLSIAYENDGHFEKLHWLQPDFTSGTRLVPGGAIIAANGYFLEVNAPNLDIQLQRYFPKCSYFKASFFDKTGTKGCLIIALLLLLPLFAAYYWGLPWLADMAVKKVPKETEAKFGELLYSSMAQSYTIDSARTQLVQQFFDSTGFSGPYKIQISVVKEPQINAFALPGGHIVVFDSILGIMTRPEELAALLAHESQHIYLQHSTRSLFREMGRSAALQVIFGDYNDLTGIIAKNSHELYGLNYSRKLEQEADDAGFEAMRQHQINPNGMASMFQKMLDAIPAAETPGAQFTSTHPDMAERIRQVQQKLDQIPEGDWSRGKNLENLFEKIR